MPQDQNLITSSFKLDISEYQRYFAQTLPCGAIERFQIGSKLGKGASGAVWILQEDTGAKRVRALKFVKGSVGLGNKEVESLIALNQVVSPCQTLS